MRLSYQGPASCSVLVDENGGVSDSLATPKSQNRSKSSENTGRWGDPPADASRSARRSKRSLEQVHRYRPPGLLDGDGIGDRDVGLDGVGGGGADGVDPVAHANQLVNGFASDRTLNARTNNDYKKASLPRQMYDAMLALKSPGTGHWQQQQPSQSPRVKHRKRHTSDVIVYRKEDSEGVMTADGGKGHVNETVDIVPLDSETRIRVNLTIASDGSAGSPVYTVSLSLPNAAQQPDPVEPVRPVEPAAAQPPPQPVAASPYSGGTNCECFCPCLDDDEDDDGSGGGRTTVDVMFSATSTPSTSTEVGSVDTSSTFWTTYPSSSEQPETTAGVLTCPPPVLLFCEPGKLLPHRVFSISGHDNSEDDNSDYRQTLSILPSPSPLRQLQTIVS